MTQTECLDWRKRVEFYGKKWQDYKTRYYNRYPSQSTVRRWVREFDKTKR